ncbi:P-loop containing nucleoside triphosphate hydrolase protein [Gongronella butleri]|nr:P-loop containing nucleoside triphosphate hydrolase protein [Gongronella butleri]
MVSKDADAPAVAAVQVAVRIRPLTERDRQLPRFAAAHHDDVLHTQNNAVVVSAPHNKIFTFDHVFGPDTPQAEIFTTLGDKAIRQFVEGYNVTMLAYGQTSSGKTYTMGTAQLKGQYDPLQEGIVPRASTLLFDLLHQLQQVQQPRALSAASSRPTSPLHSSTSLDGTRRRPLSRISYTPASSSAHSSTFRYTLKVSFVELYNEELIDLLNDAPAHERPQVTIREDPKGQIYWTGVKELVATSVEDILQFLQMGTQNRATSATDMNEQSSRSHAIFSITLRQEKWVAHPVATSSASRTPAASPKPRARPLSAVNTRMNGDDDASGNGDWVITTSKLHFVDLAGSERLKRTAAEGDRRKEGININSGLLALGNVISALGDVTKRGTHIPYRDSKLTRLLQDSLGGSAMTLMIACVSPAEYNVSESLNTLQYANRARNIKNRVEKNEIEEWLVSDNVEMLRGIITKLKQELRQYQQPRASSSASMRPSSRLQQPFASLSASSSSASASPASPPLSHQLNVMPPPPPPPLALPLSPSSSVSGRASMDVSSLLERNQWLEQQIIALQQQKEQRVLSPPPLDDFEHLVEPVIQEYETSLTALESQLSLSKAAMNHADFHIEELTARVDEQASTIAQHEAKLAHLTEQDQFKQVYIAELESKLMHTVQDAEQDEELLTELKFRIAKFKEMDQKTEQYIRELEAKVQLHETKVTDLHAQLAVAHRQIRQFEQQTDELQRRVDQHQLEPATTRRTLDQLRKRMLVANHTNANHVPNATTSPVSAAIESKDKTVLASTMASLQHVQTEYAALKERYKVWNATPATIANETAANDATNASSPSSNGVQDAQITDNDAVKGGKSKKDQERVRHIVQQYQSQLDRIQNALQRTDMLLTMANDPDNDHDHDNDDVTSIKDLQDLRHQLHDRRQAIDHAIQSYNTDTQEIHDLDAIKQQIELHRSKTYVLQTRLQKIEVAMHTKHQRRRRKSSLPMDQTHDSIEELMKKMDDMKLQLAREQSAE